TMEYVAKKVKDHVGAIGVDLSFVAEFSKKMKLFISPRRVIGNGSKTSVDAITGFLTSGMTCNVESFVRAGCIRVRFDKQDRYYDIEYNKVKSVLDIKMKIQKETTIPYAKQRLIYDDHVLANSTILREVGIEEGDLIILATNPRILKILMPNGKEVTLVVDNDEMTQNICERACNEAQMRLQVKHFNIQGIRIERNKLMGELEFQSEVVCSIEEDGGISIDVMITPKKMIRINVQEQDTILSVKKKINIQERIAINSIKLLFNRIELQDEKTIKDYNIKQGHMLDLAPQMQIVKPHFQRSFSQSQENSQIFVKTLTGETLILNVCLNDSIEEVKRQIQSKVKYSISDQVLVYGGRYLDDLLSLYDYNIHAHATLSLKNRLPGGNPRQMVNVSSSLTDLKWKENGPRWRVALP
ncbi:MAG: putative ubiquitin 4, partial [Streblomastix strix]